MGAFVCVLKKKIGKLPLNVYNTKKGDYEDNIRMSIPVREYIGTMSIIEVFTCSYFR